MEIENIQTLEIDIQEIGPQGLSAYEIYLQGGGTLSETEWLESLKGETGATPDIQAGETITLQPEEQAQVTRTGTIENPVFTFAIPQGKEGVQGIRGPEGKQGPEGPQGPEGKQGPQGIQGPEGKQGIQGPEGKAGEDGKSAYQIWLEQGNEGTEQDFLNSLVGPEGAAGTSLEEVKEITGNLENLLTKDKSNLVNAINEILNNSGGIKEITGDTDMTTLPYGIYHITAELRVMLSIGATKGIVSSMFAEYDFVFWDGVKTIIALGSGGNSPRIKAYYVYSGIGREKEVPLFTVVDLATPQTIVAKKTFSVLPESSVTPTTNDQLVNKSYVDTAITNAIGTALGGEY